MTNKFLAFEGPKFFFNLVVEITLIKFDGTVKIDNEIKKIASGELDYDDVIQKEVDVLFPKDAIDFYHSGEYQEMLKSLSVMKGLEFTINSTKYFFWWDDQEGNPVMKVKRLGSTPYPKHEEWKQKIEKRKKETKKIKRVK